MFKAFCDSLEAYQKSGKLAMVLFQFPPWFDCKRENVNYLRWCKAEMGDIPVAIEFRNQSWYRPNVVQQTLDFIEKEGWIHTVCDEPQAGEDPFLLFCMPPIKIKPWCAFMAVTCMVGKGLLRG